MMRPLIFPVTTAQASGLSSLCQSSISSRLARLVWYSFQPLNSGVLSRRTGITLHPRSTALRTADGIAPSSGRFKMDLLGRLPPSIRPRVLPRAGAIGVAACALAPTEAEDGQHCPPPRRVSQDRSQVP